MCAFVLVPIVKQKTQEKPKEVNKLNMEKKLFREYSNYGFIDIANVKITYCLMKNSKHQ